MRRFLWIGLPVIALVLLVPRVAFSGVRLGDLVALMQRLNGSPQYAQSISATGTSAVQLTAFNGGETIMLQPSADVFCKGTTSDSGVATTTTGWKILADAERYITLKSNETHVACITASGSSTVRLFKME